MTSTEDRKAQKVLEYLKEKYNEEFVLVAQYDDNYDIPYREYVLYAKNNLGKKFSVYEGKDGYSDNYYGILIQEEYQKLLADIISPIIPDAKIYFDFTAGYFDEDLNQTVDLVTAIERDKKQFFSNVWIFTRGKNELSELEFNNICEAFSTRNMTLYIACYEIHHKDYLELSQENYSDYLQEHYEINPMYKNTIK